MTNASDEVESPGPGLYSALLLSGIWLMWPLLAFLGGQGLSPLITLAGLLLIWAARIGLKLKLYQLALMGFLVWATVSTLWSPRHIEFVEYSLTKLRFAVKLEVIRVAGVLAGAGLVIAIAKSLNPKRAGMVVGAVRIGLLVQLAVVALLVVFQHQVVAFFAPYERGPGQGEQNIDRNSQILTLALPILVAVLPSAFLGGVAVVAVVACAVGLGVQSTLLAVPLAIVFALAMRVFPRSGFKLIGYGLGVYMLSAPLLFGVLVHQFGGRPVTGTNTWRLEIWRRVLKVIEAHPVTGAGLGVTRTMMETFPDGPEGIKGHLIVPNHAHNMLLHIWAETGLIGAGLLAATFVLFGRSLPTPAEAGPAAYAGAATVAVLLVNCSVSFDPWNDWWWAAAGFCAAALAAISRLPRAAPAPEPIAISGLT